MRLGKSDLVMFVLFVIFVTLIWFLTSIVTTGLSKEKDKYKAKIGEKVVLEKDTLTVVDYSSILENFTLSNGKKVDASFVFSKDSVSVK